MSMFRERRYDPVMVRPLNVIVTAIERCDSTTMSLNEQARFA